MFSIFALKIFDSHVMGKRNSSLKTLSNLPGGISNLEVQCT